MMKVQTSFQDAAMMDQQLWSKSARTDTQLAAQAALTVVYRFRDFTKIRGVQFTVKMTSWYTMRTSCPLRKI